MIAITGAAGFIGSNLAHRLAKMGHHLFLIDHPFPVAKATELGRFAALLLRYRRHVLGSSA